MLRILYDDFDQKVKNIHDEMDLHHSYKKKLVSVGFLLKFNLFFLYDFNYLIFFFYLEIYKQNAIFFLVFTNFITFY